MDLPIPRRGSDAISPTAHYPGHVWSRNGLSHPELATAEGRWMFAYLEPAMRVSRLVGGPTLEGLLLARHRIIDELLARAIDEGRVSTVVEIACGMSPRGWRFTERYGDRLVYVEADLPEMAERKRRALERIGSLGEDHRVVTLDALRDQGPRSLAELASGLDHEAGAAIVTEGLLTYFDDDAVAGMLRRFALALGRFASGLYLSDVRLGGPQPFFPDRAFATALSVFVSRQVHTHFGDEETAERALRDAGFAQARLHRADAHPAAGETGRDPGAANVHIIEARTEKAPPSQGLPSSG